LALVMQVSRSSATPAVARGDQRLSQEPFTLCIPPCATFSIDSLAMFLPN
jgi:hypothetical protein